MSVVYQFTVRLAKRNGSALSAVQIIENLIGAGWSLFSEENKIIYTDVGDEDDYDYIVGSLDKGTYYKIVRQKQQRGEPIAFAMFYAEAGCRYRMDFIILASNESSGCLQTFDDCREGQISSQLAAKYLTASDFYVIVSPGDCTRKMLSNAAELLDVNWYLPKIIPYLTDGKMIVEGYSFEKY